MSQLGHNKMDEAEEQKTQSFYKFLADFQGEKSEIASSMSNIKEIYKNASYQGIDRSSFAYAVKLLKGELAIDKEILDLKNKLWVASKIAPRIAKQFDIFGEDEVSREEIIAAEAFAAGARREPNSNPYDGKDGQVWQENYNAGTTFINKELAKAMDADNDDEAEDDSDSAKAENF